MSSPTQRSLARLRADGYLAEVVEKWIPAVKRRRDLYGFIDILAIRGDEVVGVQATSASNVAARIAKITEHPNVGAVRKAGIRILVHGWAKRGRRWQCREADLS